MSLVDDEFDLDLRLSVVASAGSTPGDALGGIGIEPRDDHDETMAPQATCPAETCGLDCLTQTCPEETCGCNTNETCTHACANPDAITFGAYCEDQSDDTCHACAEPGTAACADPPD